MSNTSTPTAGSARVTIVESTSTEVKARTERDQTLRNADGTISPELVVTYSTTRGSRTALTHTQIDRLAESGITLRNSRGDVVTANISHGSHIGEPTWTDAELEKEIAECGGKKWLDRANGSILEFNRLAKAK